MNISVIGAGTFGTALANALKKESEIRIYTRNVSVISEINNTRINKTYFPNKILTKQIKATDNIKQVNTSDIIFLCIPSHTVIDFIKKLDLSKNALVVNGAKGFGIGNKLIPESLNDIISNNIASIKGPSFANEMIYELPTAFTIASNQREDFILIKSLFREETIVFDFSNDVRGVEILSIVKNIYAIIIGIVDATFNSSNVRFLIFTKALSEMKRLLHILSICPDTIFCYSGIGDFGLTALNDLSRNRTLGLLIGKGFFGKEISNSVVLEGVNAIENFIKMIPPSQVSTLPLLINLDNLLKAKMDTRQFVNNVIYN